jgi:hypothetical protein
MTELFFNIAQYAAAPRLGPRCAFMLPSKTKWQHAPRGQAGSGRGRLPFPPLREGRRNQNCLRNKTSSFAPPASRGRAGGKLSRQPLDGEETLLRKEYRLIKEIFHERPTCHADNGIV